MLLALALTACNADIALLAKDDISAGDDTDAMVIDTLDDTDAFVRPPGVADDGGPIETYFALSNDLQWPESRNRPMSTLGRLHDLMGYHKMPIASGRSRSRAANASGARVQSSRAT